MRGDAGDDGDASADRRMDRRALVTAVGTGLSAALAGCIGDAEEAPVETRTGEARREVAAGTGLRVDNPNGDVRVEGWDGDAVVVEFELEGPSEDLLADAAVDATESDGRLDVTTTYADAATRDQVTAVLSIRCPEDVPVERVETDDGSVHVRSVAGDPTVRTGNGTVVAREVDGAVDLATENGRVTAREVAAVAGIESDNGAVDVYVAALAGDAAISTVSGSIDGAVSTALDADLTARTVNGSVDVAGLGLDRTEDGPTSVAGTLGDGGPALDFSTQDGSIELRPFEGAD